MEEGHSCNNGRKFNCILEHIKFVKEDPERQITSGEVNNMTIYLCNNSWMIDLGKMGRKKIMGIQSIGKGKTLSRSFS